MLDLEAEVFIGIGAWKNFEELEESLTLPELDLLLQTLRQDKKDTNVFLAALQGVDLKKHYGSPEDDLRREIEKRAAIRAAGGEDEYESQEFAMFGIDFADEDE